MRRFRNKFSSPEERLFKKNHEEFLALAEKCRDDSTDLDDVIELLRLFREQAKLLRELMNKI